MLARANVAQAEVVVSTSFDGADPMLAQMRSLWSSLAGADGRLPSRRDVDPSRIPPRLLPHVWLLDVQASPRRYRYRLTGTAIVDALQRDTIGQWLDQAHPGAKGSPAMYKALDGVVDERRPYRTKGYPVFWQPANYRQAESGFFPLAEDGRQVDVILAFTLLHAYGSV